jgi:hypothetical protein
LTSIFKTVEKYFQRQIKEHTLLLSYITIKRFLTHIKITKSIESLFTFKSCKTYKTNIQTLSLHHLLKFNYVQLKFLSAILRVNSCEIVVKITKF